MATSPNPLTQPKKPLPKPSSEWVDYIPQESDWVDVPEAPKTQAAPPQKPSTLLTGLVSPEAARRKLFGEDEGEPTQEEITAAREAEVAKGASPYKAGALEFARGVREDIGNVASSLTSPFSIGATLLAPFRAGRIAAGVAGVGMGAKDLSYQPRWVGTPEGEGRFESPAEVIQRQLLGASGVAGGTAGAKSGFAPKTTPVRSFIRENIQPAIRKIPVVGKMLKGRDVNVGTESLFRALDPAGSNVKFRENLEAARGDLAEMQRQNPLKTSGGILKRDPRFSEVVEKIDEHLDKMYQEERAQPIQQVAQNPVTVKGNPQIIQDVATRLANELPIDSPAMSVARRLAQDPAQPITMAEADILGRTVNSELRKFQSMTPEQQALVSDINRKMSHYASADEALNTTIGQELHNRGLADLGSYERRYAALNQMRQQANVRRNPVEKARLFERIREVIPGFGAPRTYASGAVLMGGPGTKLEKGLKRLALSGIEPQRGVAPPAPPIAGALPPPRVMPTAPTPFQGPSPVYPGPVTQGRMLPAPGGTGAQPYQTGTPRGASTVPVKTEGPTATIRHPLAEDMAVENLARTKQLMAPKEGAPATEAASGTTIGSRPLSQRSGTAVTPHEGRRAPLTPREQIKLPAVPKKKGGGPTEEEIMHGENLPLNPKRPVTKTSDLLKEAKKTQKELHKTMKELGMQVKFKTKSGKVGVVDKEGKFSVKQPASTEELYRDHSTSDLKRELLAEPGQMAKKTEIPNMRQELKRREAAAKPIGGKMKVLRRFKDSKGFDMVEVELPDGKKVKMQADDFDE